MKKATLLAMTTALLLLSACGTTQEKEPTKDSSANASTTLNVMEVQELGSMDTIFTQDETSIIAQANIFEGLYTLDENDIVIPAVATELPEISDDGKTYTITLKKEAKWANDTPVTAADFVFAWQKMVNPDNGANYFFLMDGTILNGTAIINGEKKPEELGVKAIDDHTLEVTLEKPVPYFVSLLTFPPFFPQNEAFVKEKGKNYGTSSDDILPNGPFLMENWNQSSLDWDLVKNPNYHDAKAVKSDKIHFQVLKETGTAFNLFETGELDVALLSGDYAKQNADNPNFVATPRSFVSYFKFNQLRVDKPSIFANANVRHAVAAAVDKKGLVDNILANGSTAIFGYIPKGFVKNPVTAQDFREEAGEVGQTDLDLANSYWEKAQKEIDGEIAIEMVTSDADADKRVAEFIQGQLQETLPGLKLTIKSLPMNNLIDLTKKGDYELAIGTWGPDYQDPLSFLANLTTGNNSNFSSEAYDQLIDDATNKFANEPEKRWQALIDAEKILIEDEAGIVPIYQHAAAQLVRDGVSGIQQHSFGAPFTYKYAVKK